MISAISFHDISPKKLAIIIIVAGVLVVFAISGFQARNLFAPSVTEEAVVSIKQGTTCIVEGSDRVPREIRDCPYNEGDPLLITYKQQQPSLEKHELRKVAP